MDYISISPTITDPALQRMQEQTSALPIATQHSHGQSQGQASSYVQVADKPQEGLLTTIGRVMVANKIAILLIVAALVAVIIAYFVFSKPTNVDADKNSGKDLENGTGAGPPQGPISAPPAPRRPTPEALANLQRMLDEDPNAADAVQKESETDAPAEALSAAPIQPEPQAMSPPSIDLSWSSAGPSIADMQATQEVPAKVEDAVETVAAVAEEKPKRGKQSTKKSA